MPDFDSTYDEAYGPSMRRSIKRSDGEMSDSAKVRKGPRDLMRSQRVGLTRLICVGCDANTNETPIKHHRSCPEIRVDRFRRERQRAELPKRFAAKPDWRTT
jgi:hypothetical protein